MLIAILDYNYNSSYEIYQMHYKFASLINWKLFNVSIQLNDYLKLWSVTEFIKLKITIHGSGRGSSNAHKVNVPKWLSNIIILNCLTCTKIYIIALTML